MKSEGVILAFDTSNYTTSVSVMTESGELLANLKQLLTVKSGERGLRQSDAVFLHTVNLPTLTARAREVIGDRKVVCVGVSDRPRNIEGSYMPCFLVGVAAASCVADALGVPLIRFSHQCGHIMAAVYSSGNFELLNSHFAAFHISGGTTELLRVKYSGVGFESELVGGTLDLNAGQIIDRVGVYMGLSFPSGREMESLALEYDGKIPKRKMSVSNMTVNLSGLENIAKKMYDTTGDKRLVSRFVFDYIGRALVSLSKSYEEKHGKSLFVYAGGVMSNSIIKNMLSECFSSSFAEPMLSSDNAVGIAELTRRAYKKEMGCD